MAHITFGCRLKELRLEKNISLRDLAKRLGVTPTYISLIEQEYCKPPASGLVEKMARILDQNPDKLLLLAGRFPEDLCTFIQTHPDSTLSFMHFAATLTESQISDFARLADQLQLQAQS